eukprot:1145467-Pelagomonas_calceolata.AAC.2
MSFLLPSTHKITFGQGCHANSPITCSLNGKRTHTKSKFINITIMSYEWMLDSGKGRHRTSRMNIRVQGSSGSQLDRVLKQREKTLRIPSLVMCSHG